MGIRRVLSAAQTRAAGPDPRRPRVSARLFGAGLGAGLIVLGVPIAPINASAPERPWYDASGTDPVEHENVSHEVPTPPRIDVNLLPLAHLADALDNGVVLAVRREVLLVPQEALAAAAQDARERPWSARRESGEREARRMARAWRWHDAVFPPARWWASSALAPGVARVEDRLSLRYSTLSRTYELRFERLDLRLNPVVANGAGSDPDVRTAHRGLQRGLGVEAFGAEGYDTGRLPWALTGGGVTQGSAILRRAVFNDLVAALTEGERWLREIESGHDHVAFAARVRFDTQALPLPLQWSDAVMRLPPLDGRRGETWQTLLP